MYELIHSPLKLYLSLNSSFCVKVGSEYYWEDPLIEDDDLWLIKFLNKLPNYRTWMWKWCVHSTKKMWEDE